MPRLQHALSQGLPVAMVLVAASLAAPLQAQERRFSMAWGARAFAATLGKQCLSQDQASIDADQTSVTVRDHPACAKEIEEIAANWLLYAGDGLTTFTGSPEALTLTRAKLEQQFGRSPNLNLRFLASTQSCRCLAITGKQRTPAAQLASQTLPKPPPRPEVKHKEHALEPWEAPALNQEDVLKGGGKLPVPASSALLVN